MKPFPVLLPWLCLLVGVFFASLSPAGASQEKPQLPLAMEVFLKKPQARVYELEIHLTNISEEMVWVNVRDLPWNPPNDSKWFSLFKMDEQESLVKQLVQDWNFGSRMIQILPGESIQDTMVLNPRMPSLLDDVAQFGVKLRWDCPPTSLKFICHQGAPQQVVIPKGDDGNVTVYSADAPVCVKLGQTIGLIKIPESHEVLFLLTPESTMVDVPHMQALLYAVNDYVQQCQPSWTNSWAVSFFTEEQYAGFLSDEGNREYFKQGIWQQVNIGQYSSQIRTLFRFPWIKKRADDVYISVYR
ncbi:MAG: hypothetical protein OEZ57_14070 [Nitrospirota bacterium]|nr:hypothetical protein [Nitrospirota bacterium]MDH5586315.1 hypothetical protein [Nitrospirota bacterium]MDH5776030.1 hypothetical protein [Nitrospirota bacterium]